MKHYSVKNIHLADFKGMITDVDLKSRTVTGYFSRFGNVDSDGDMLVEGAFSKSIKERGREGKNILPHLLDHSVHETLKQLSKPVLSEKADGGFFESQISDTQNGIDTLKLYRDGVINQHSFGFKTIKNQQKSGYNEIQEVMLYEISTVTLGANSETPFTGFKGLTSNQLIEKYQTLQRCYDSGDYSDEVFPILKAQLLELKELLVDTYVQTFTVPPSTQPNPLVDAVQLLILKNF